MNYKYEYYITKPRSYSPKVEIWPAEIDVQNKESHLVKIEGFQDTIVEISKIITDIAYGRCSKTKEELFDLNRKLTKQYRNTFK